MSKDDKFFQFPISALRLDKSIDNVDVHMAKERLNEIIDYCILEVGNRLVERGEGDADLCAQHFKLEYDDSDHQKAWLCGARCLNVKIPSVNELSGVSGHRRISQMDTGKQVRVKTDYLWDCINEQMTWRDFATLCAVYCGIGASRAARLSFDYIAILALGYSSKSELLRHDKGKLPLDRRKTGFTVRKLQKANFFASASPNHRHNFYSNSLECDKLAERLVAKELEKARPSASSITAMIRSRVDSKLPKKGAES